MFLGFRFDNRDYYSPIAAPSKFKKWILSILLNCEIFEYSEDLLYSHEGFDFLKNINR